MKKIIAAILCLMMVVSVLAACGSDDKAEKATEKATEKAAEQATEKAKEKGDMSMVLSGSITDLSQVPAQDLSNVDANYQKKAPEKGDVVAIIHTNYGDIKLRFFPEVAPMAVNNFIALAKAGKYDSTIIHRIFHQGIHGIQGGDYEYFNGTGGEAIYGTSFGYETSPFVGNIEGSLAMAHSSLPDSNGSQFYINQTDNSMYLDGGYTVFGQVYEGMDVVNTIAALERDANDRPLTDVIVSTIEITTY